MTDGRSRRIQVLRDSVARQIAAGEVIDRPSSVVRELLDNSIDAGAAEVDVYLDSGGVSSIRVVDGGTGMTREDLDLCWHSHTTSKIENVQDLDRLVSLGFRGEALSSIAACSRLQITSRTAEEKTAHRLRVESGKLLSLTESPGEIGCVVDVSDLFYSLPARRKFLKSPSAETAKCRSTFVEKSLPFPNVAFRLYSSGEMNLYLPAASTLDERVAAAHSTVVDPSLLHRVDARGEGFSVSIVMGGTSLYRRDRRYIWSYVNNRRIDEYALTQAVQYGFADHLPGGNFPVAFIFISTDPELVDFNVHPAKREARFRNLAEIHHALVTAIRGYLERFSVRFEEVGAEGRNTRPGEARDEGPRRGSPTPKIALPASIADMGADLAPRPAPPASTDIHYYGQLFELFLLASVGDRFFIVDQHAAHERILFERLRREPGPPQKLLVPIPFDVTKDEERLLEASEAFRHSVGINVRRISQGNWEVVSLPEGFHGAEEEVVAFVKQARGTERDLEQELFARMSCRAAVKEGDSLDAIAATELLKAAFALENARCPHGRPIWYELSKSGLYHLVGRL